MSIISGTAHSSGDSGFYGFEIGQSLRFDGSSYLSQTFSNTPTSNQNMTWSLWVKKVANSTGTVECFFSQKGGTTASQRDAVYIDSVSDQLITTKYTGSATAYQLKTSQVFRDLSAWVHLVYVFDLDNGTQSERLKLYVNGSEVTQLATDTKPSNTTSTSYFGNNSYPAMIGQDANVSSRFFSGYLANIQFIDGQALDATYFGETKSGVWIPKAYTGSYGNNGFRLTFSNASDLGEDSSGNNNDWTVN